MEAKKDTNAEELALVSVLREGLIVSFCLYVMLMCMNGCAF